MYFRIFNSRKKFTNKVTKKLQKNVCEILT